MDSGDSSSPHRRETPADTNISPESPPPPPSRVKLMCSYNGRIQPRPHDNHLTYFGGETKILAVDRSINFSTIISKLAALQGSSSPDLITLKYQLPGEDLDNLISVTTDEDLEEMLLEYDRLAKPAPRLRLFLFPSNRSGTDLDNKKSAPVPDLLSGNAGDQPKQIDAETEVIQKRVIEIKIPESLIQHNRNEEQISRVYNRNHAQGTTTHYQIPISNSSFPAGYCPHYSYYPAYMNPASYAYYQNLFSRTSPPANFPAMYGMGLPGVSPLDPVNAGMDAETAAAQMMYDGGSAYQTLAGAANFPANFPAMYGLPPSRISPLFRPASGMDAVTSAGEMTFDGETAFQLVPGAANFPAMYGMAPSRVSPLVRPASGTDAVISAVQMGSDGVTACHTVAVPANFPATYGIAPSRVSPLVPPTSGMDAVTSAGQMVSGSTVRSVSPLAPSTSAMDAVTTAGQMVSDGVTAYQTVAGAANIPSTYGMAPSRVSPLVSPTSGTDTVTTAAQVVYDGTVRPVTTGNQTYGMAPSRVSPTSGMDTVTTAAQVMFDGTVRPVTYFNVATAGRSVVPLTVTAVPASGVDGRR